MTTIWAESAIADAEGLETSDPAEANRIARRLLMVDDVPADIAARADALAHRTRASSSEATDGETRGTSSEAIRLLFGHARSRREYELLIEALRATPGREDDVEAQMRAYLERYPGTPRARAYEQYLRAHGAVDEDER